MNDRVRRLGATFVAGLFLTTLGAGAVLAREVAPTTATGTLPLRESFSSAFGKWRLSIDGAARIATDRGKTGAGLLLNVPVENTALANRVNRAYARYELSEGTNGLTASGWFRVMAAACDTSGGWTKGNTPLFRLFDASGRRIAGVFAAKAPCGSLRPVYVQHSFDNYYRTTGRIALRAWNRIQLSVTVSTPGRSLVEVRVNGARVYRTTLASNGFDPIAAVQLGNEHLGQSGRFVVDDIRLDRLAATAPAADTCTPGTPSPFATQTSGSTVIASSFEDRTLAGWNVGLSGTGTVTVGSTYAHDGTCAARIRSSQTVMSRATLSADLTTGSTDAAAEGWFNIQREGATGSNVPFFRMMRGSARTIDVYRQNVTGVLWLAVREGATTTRKNLGVTVPLGTWVQVAVHANAVTGVVEVWLDGTLRTVAGMPYALGGSTFTRVVLGNEAYRQLYDLWVDGIVISASPAS